MVISFIGYQTQEVPVNNQQKFSINLKEDSQQLQEVVVMAVGYGDVRRKDLTGSIAKADIKELIKTPVNNVAESLGEHHHNPLPLPLLLAAVVNTLLS